MLDAMKSGKLSLVAALTAVFTIMAIAVVLADHHKTASPNKLTAQEKEAGWILLFDGKTLDGWRGYQMEDAPAYWKVEDGAITLTPEKGAKDLVTTKQFDDFELVVEWKIAEGGNSGILFRASEDGKMIWHSAVEIQVLDNDNFHGKPIGLEHAAGAVYALWPAKKESFREQGAWNETRVVAKGPSVTVYHNGTKIATYDTGSEEWKKRITASKFVKFPGMGELPKGHIALQSHGSAVQFRGIKLKKL